MTRRRVLVSEEHIDSSSGVPASDIASGAAALPDVDALVSVILIAVVMLGVAGMWVITLVRVRSNRRLGVDLAGRAQRAIELNRTAVLVTIAGLVVIVLVSVWWMLRVLS